MSIWASFARLFVVPSQGSTAPADVPQAEARATVMGSIENPNTPINADTLSLIGSNISKSGVIVTRDLILSLPAFWRAVQILGGVIASMPVDVYRVDDDESAMKQRLHPVSRLIGKEPSELYTKFDFLQTLVVHLITCGNFYALIERNPQSGRPVSLTILDPDNVAPTLNDRGQLRYMVKARERGYAPDRIFHVSNLSWAGYVGYNMPALHRDNYGVALANRDYGNQFYSNGAHLSGLLTTDKALSNEARTKISTSWKLAFSGATNAGKTALLDEGMRYERLGLTPGEAQFGETKKLTIADIARITGVPQFLLEDLDRATFNNIEHLSQQFVTYTIMPLCQNIQEEMSRKLLSEEEKDAGYEIRFDLNYLLRADIRSRGAYIDSVMKWGIFNRDEVRQMEGKNPITDGSGTAYYVPMNMVDPTQEEPGEQQSEQNETNDDNEQPGANQ